MSKMRDTRRAQKSRKVIAKALKTARTAAKLTVQAAAKKVGVSAMTWHRWELAQSQLPADRLMAITDVLQTTVIYLLTGKTIPMIADLIRDSGDGEVMARMRDGLTRQVT